MNKSIRLHKGRNAINNILSLCNEVLLGVTLILVPSPSPAVIVPGITISIKKGDKHLQVVQ